MDYRIHPGLDPNIDPRLHHHRMDPEINHRMNNPEISPRSDDSSEMDTGSSRYPDYCKTMIVKDSHGQVKELVFPKALDLDRPKRARTTFSPEQLYQLEKEFQRNQYLVGRERTELSRTLQLSGTQIKVWFQNRRTKYKRDKHKDHDVTTKPSTDGNLMNILQPMPSVTMNSSPTTVAQLPSIPSGQLQQPSFTSPVTSASLSHYRPLPFPLMASHPGLFPPAPPHYLPRS